MKIDMVNITDIAIEKHFIGFYNEKIDENTKRYLSVSEIKDIYVKDLIKYN